MNKAKIVWNNHWPLTDKTRKVLERLVELGVCVDTVNTDKKLNYVLKVPFGMDVPVYVEVGYLLAQLGDETFPDDFGYDRCISGIKSKIVTNSCHAINPIRFDLDSDCYKFELYLKEEFEDMKRST